MFACTLKDFKENTMLIRQARKYNCWRTFIDNYELGNVRFENMKIKNISQEIIKMFVTK